MNKKIILSALTIAYLCLTMSVIAQTGSQTATDYYNRARKTGFDSDEVISDYAKAIELNPKFTDAYFWRGWAYYLGSKPEKALADLDKVVELDPRYRNKEYNGSVYFLRGRVYENLHKPDLALTDFNKMIGFEPANPIYYRERADFYIRVIKNYELGIQDYTTEIKLDPKYKWCYEGRARAYKLIGKYDLAIADLTEFISIASTDSDNWQEMGYSERGDLYEKKGNYMHAIEDFSKTIELRPTDSFFYLDRAEVYRKTGQEKLAEEDEKKARELKKTDN